MARLIITLFLAAVIVLTFDVQHRVYEDGSVAVTACIPFAACAEGQR